METNPIPPAPYLLLFDGLCHLCSNSVQWVLAHDHSGMIKFASIQSELGRSLYGQHGFDPDQPQSMMLITPAGVFTKSDATIQLSMLMGGWHRGMKIFRLIPRPLRDFFYDVIAHHRYRWFGKHEACWLPKPEWRNRFLS